MITYTVTVLGIVFQMSAFNDSTMVPLSNLFFVKQMKAMHSFFQLSQQQVATLQGNIVVMYVNLRLEKK